MSTRPRIRAFLAGAALAVLGLPGLAISPAHAQYGKCQQLQKSYQQELDSADTLKSKAAQQAMQSGSS